jgi:hypothetical protein
MKDHDYLTINLIVSFSHSTWTIYITWEHSFWKNWNLFDTINILKYFNKVIHTWKYILSTWIIILNIVSTCIFEAYEHYSFRCSNLFLHARTFPPRTWRFYFKFFHMNIYFRSIEIFSKHMNNFFTCFNLFYICE